MKFVINLLSRLLKSKSHDGKINIYETPKFNFDLIVKHKNYIYLGAFCMEIQLIISFASKVTLIF